MPLESKNEHFYRHRVEQNEPPGFVNFWLQFMPLLEQHKAQGNLTFPEETDSFYLLLIIAASAYAAGAEERIGVK